MPRVLIKKLVRVRSTRDLRAEILDLASNAISSKRAARLDVIAPTISEERVRNEWDRVLPALDAEARTLLSLRIEAEESSTSNTAVALVKPNYRFELLRLLVNASLHQQGSLTLATLIEILGASQTPIRSALMSLRSAELISSSRRTEINPEHLSVDVLSRVGALPQTLRFRFERGARIKDPPQLLSRACALLGEAGPADWQAFALSGTAAATLTVPMLNLAGNPRLDLVLHAPRECDALETRLLRRLDDGLEVEPNVLAPTPVVVTLLRARQFDTRPLGQPPVRCATPADVLLSLLDLGLRGQAIQYAKATRLLTKNPAAR